MIRINPKLISAETRVIAQTGQRTTFHIICISTNMPKISGGIRKKRRTFQKTQEEKDHDENKNVPSSFVIRRGRVSSSYKCLVRNWRHIMSPYCAVKLRESSNNSLKDFVHISGVFGVTHMIVFSQTNTISYMKFIKLPQGPTVTFRVHDYSLMEDVQRNQKRPQSSSKPYLTSPILILNAFRCESEPTLKEDEFKLNLLSQLLGNMFPSLDLTNPSLLSLQRYRRTILFSRDKKTDRIMIRHYYISRRPAGLSKTIRNLVWSTRKTLDIFDCAKYNDISELILNPSSQLGHNTQKKDLKSSEDSSDEESYLTVPHIEKCSGEASPQAISLYELGPRLTLSLVRIEEGIAEGKGLEEYISSKLSVLVSIMSDQPAILIDIGSDTLKAGLETDSRPTCVIPTLVGTRRKAFVDPNDPTLYYIGDDAINQSHMLSFSYPVDHGHIEDWDQIELLLDHIFKNKLHVESRDRRLLFTEPPFASVHHREALVETMMETHLVSEINLSIQGILALYAAGKITGMVIEVGEGVTQVVPVYDGYTSANVMKRWDFGGQEVTMYLQKLLSDAGYYVTCRVDCEHVKRIKEIFGYVTEDPFIEESRPDLSREYILPDGKALRDGTRSITLGPERFYCTEVFFDPRIIERDSLSLTNLIWQSIQACPIENRKSALGSIILSGGSSLFPGFVERLEKEIKKVSPPQARSSVRVQRNSDSLFGAWIGAKIFAGISNGSPQWITRSQWEESGSSIVNRQLSFRGM